MRVLSTDLVALLDGQRLVLARNTTGNGAINLAIVESVSSDGKPTRALGRDRPGRTLDGAGIDGPDTLNRICMRRTRSSSLMNPLVRSIPPGEPGGTPGSCWRQPLKRWVSLETGSRTTQAPSRSSRFPRTTPRPRSARSLGSWPIMNNRDISIARHRLWAQALLDQPEPGPG